MSPSTLRRVAVAITCAFVLSSPVRAGAPLPIQGTYEGEAQIRAKVPGAGTAGGPVDIQLSFGPTAEPALDAGEFLIVADDSVETLEITGTFVVDEKGQPVLTVDTDLLALDLKTLLIHVCLDVLLVDPADCAEIEDLDVLVDVARMKLKAKASQKNGETLAFSAKIPFVLTDGMLTGATITVSLKTKPPAILPP